MNIRFVAITFLICFSSSLKGQIFSSWLKLHMANDSIGFGPTPQIFNIGERKDHHLFVCTYFTLQEYNGASWDYHLFPKIVFPTNYQNVFDVCFGINGETYVATSDTINILDTNGIWTTITGTGFPTGWHTGGRISSDTLGNIWVIGNDGNHNGLLKFDGNTWALFDSTNTPMQTVSGPVQCSKNGTLWVMENSRLHRYDGVNWTSFDTINSAYSINPNNAIDVDDYGNIYLVVDSINGNDETCLFQFDGTSWNKITDIITPLSIPYDIADIDIDKNGDIWILFSSGSCTVAKANATGITCYYMMTPMNGDPTCVFAAENGTIWAGYDNTGINAQNEIYLFRESGYNALEGKVFYDFNQDGIYQAGEAVIPGQVLSTLPQNMNTMSNVSGYHQNLPDTIGTYNISLQVPNFWQLTSTPATYQVTQFSPLEVTDSLDFGIYPVSMIDDAKIDLFICGITPGFISSGFISYGNKGTTILSDTVTLQLDSNLTFITSSPLPLSQSGNEIKWLYSALVPFESRSISFTVQASNSIALNDTLTSYASIGPISTDAMPADNYSTRLNSITGSFDPNSKEVSPTGSGIGGNIKQDQRLTYTINFQNTGNDTAFVVVIKDTLPANADISTLTIDGYSHPYTVELNNNILTFRFDYIQLPDSGANEPASHGFIRYSVKPKTGLLQGETLKNKAYIIFDFNTAIMTNQVINTIDYTLGIEHVSKHNKIKLYPNPVTRMVYVLSDDPGTKHFYLFDIVSGLILVKPFEISAEIDLSYLAKGAYLYQVLDSKGMVDAGKLIRQ